MKALLVLSARSLALLWAVVWTYFFIAETTETAMRFWAGLPWFALGTLFIVLAVIPWRWEAAGSWILIAAAAVLGLAYMIWGPRYLPRDIKTLTTIAFSVPPLISGLLLLAHRRVVLRHAAGRRTSSFA